MPTIIFVCTGNTCRSPMAAALATSIFGQNNLDITVLSAGVAAADNYPASQNAVLAMEDENIDLTPHLSTLISQEIIVQSALILTMTTSHLQIVKNIHPTANAYTLAQYAGKKHDISDPFGGDLETYRKCAMQIKKLLTASVAKLKEELCKA